MTLSLLFSFFCFISMIDVQLANTCTHTNRVTVKKTKTNYEYCRRSPFSDRCGQIVYYNSSDWRRSTRCCTGWTGSQCDIPVCTNQKCQTNAFCVKKDDCFCRSSSIWNTACTVAKCSSSPYYTTNNDCFPGTCKTASSRECQCSSGFTGPNCRTMRDSPTFTKCQFSLLATSGGYEKVVFTGQCNSKEKLYSNARHITHVTVAWDTKYQVPEDVPSKPTYIRSYKFGITSADVQGSLKSNYGTTIDSISMKCSNQLIEASPVGMLTCSKSTYLGATTIRHGYSLQVTVKATSGGYKYVSGRLSFNGKSASQIASVTFDLEAPTHCDESYHCTHGNGPAVDMGQEFDRSTRSTHQLRWFGWNDSGSGLNTFSYKIYEMEPGISSLLTEKSQPVVTGSQTAFTTTYPTYSLPGPGMYSAVLKVTDNAGNVAAARRLMLWDPNSKVKLTDAPMSVQGKTPNDDDVVWLTFRPLGRFVAKWEGHFENAFHHNNKLLSGVKPWRAGLDDREGNLTVDAIPNVHGVVRFRFGHSDASGATPVTWEDVGLNQQFELGATLPFRMYVKAYDIMGNSATDTLGVGIDWTPPVVDGKRFSKNVDYSESKIPFSSRLSLTVSDKESGIRTIHYDVIDATDSSIIWRGEIAGQKAKQDKLSCQIDGSCVCTPFEECYRRNQVLHIDHCWLVHSVGHHVEVKAVIFNHVGLWTTTHVKLGVLDGLRGMNTCPKQLKATGRRLGAGAVVAIVIGVAWAVLLLTAFCLLGVFVMTRLRRHEPYAPRNFADFRRTLRQSVQFGNSASTNPGEFQLSSSRQQQSTIAFDNSSRQQQPPLREAGDGDDDDVEVYGYMVTDDVADWKIDAKKVVLGKRLPNSAGRFADIFEAMMKLTDVRQSAVAKKLKHGGNDESKLLMTAKMNFWATACPKHQNILHFIGAVTSGPILLFERCDLGRLRDWLIAQTQLTDELQDNMITFSIQIARAMKHLHENKIIHRRLGARNILLKSDEVGSVVAKVAGFGPMKGEVESSMNDRAEGKIPIKWMAPEQFNLVAGTKRSYDTKTDMWSFGVTLWEIFSKGEKPYPDCGIGELKALLSTGYRMPRPTHCPDMMYDQVVTPCWDSSATLRPSFADVVTVMETVFLHGGGGDEYFYEQSEAPPEPSNNTYEAAPNHGYDNNTYEATPEPDDDTYEPTQ